MSLISNVTKAVQQVSQKVGASVAEAREAIDQVISQSREALEADKGKLSYLGTGRLDKLGERITEAMDKWLGANPNASADEIREKTVKESAKQTSIQIFDKMASDAFFRKLMARSKERMADLYD